MHNDIYRAVIGQSAGSNTELLAPNLLTLPCEIGVDQARQLILPVIPTASAFNPETEDMFAISPTEMIFYHRSLIPEFCKAACLAAARDNGHEGLATMSTFSLEAGDIGLHLRVLKARYLSWNDGVIDPISPSLGKSYAFNERRLAGGKFSQEEVSLIPETLEELFRMADFPELKPFDVSKFPLISIPKEPGRCFARWPQDFLQ